MTTGKEDPRNWDIQDRNERLASGELTDPNTPDPTEVIVEADE